MEETVFQELKNRFLTPWKRAPFLIYFICIIVLFGGCGIWTPLLGHEVGLVGRIAENIMTYSIVLAIPACISIIQTISKTKNQTSILYLTISLLLILVGTGIAFILVPTKISIIIACIGLILSWIFWIIANSDNEFFIEKPFEQEVNTNAKKLSKLLPQD